MFVQLRPGLASFLRRVSRAFEVVIFTASLRNYAGPVIDRIDPGRTVPHRLFREHCMLSSNGLVKDLASLGRDLRQTIIVDNSPVSYAFQPDNAVPIRTWIGEPEDRALFQLLTILELLAATDDVRRFLNVWEECGTNYSEAYARIREELARTHPASRHPHSLFRKSCVFQRHRKLLVLSNIDQNASDMATAQRECERGLEEEPTPEDKENRRGVEDVSGGGQVVTISRRVSELGLHECKRGNLADGSARSPPSAVAAAVRSLTKSVSMRKVIVQSQGLVMRHRPNLRLLTNPLLPKSETPSARMSLTLPLQAPAADRRGSLTTTNASACANTPSTLWHRKGRILVSKENCTFESMALMCARKEQERLPKQFARIINKRTLPEI